jgi:hypothetical protein
MMHECEICGHYDSHAGYTESCPHCGTRLPKQNTWYERVVIAPNPSKEKCLERRDSASRIMDNLQSFLIEHPEYICDELKDTYYHFKAEAEKYDEAASA